MSSLPPSDNTNAQLNKDVPLREDIRLLGRLLGDTVIEHVRQHAIHCNRSQDPRAAKEMAEALNCLSLDATNTVVRACSYFLHLANTAEDQHHIRRKRAHALAGSKTQGGKPATHPGTTDRGRRQSVGAGCLLGLSPGSARCSPPIPPKSRSIICRSNSCVGIVLGKPMNVCAAASTCRSMAPQRACVTAVELRLFSKIAASSWLITRQAFA